MDIRNLISMFLICGLLASCASSPVGERHPSAARYACPLETESCSLDLRHEDWAFAGSYAVEKIADNRYRVHGRFKVDTTKLLSAYTYSRVMITFYFFDADEIVEELRVTVRGKANQFSQFSKKLVTDQKLDSTIFELSNIKVSEVPL